MAKHSQRHGARQESGKENRMREPAVAPEVAIHNGCRIEIRSHQGRESRSRLPPPPRLALACLDGKSRPRCLKPPPRVRTPMPRRIPLKLELEYSQAVWFSTQIHELKC